MGRGKRDAGTSVFVIHGPFALPLATLSGQKPDGQDVELFWQGIDPPDLPKRRGFFILALKKGLRITPWYVGHATRSFASECFSDKTLGAFAQVSTARRGRSTPLVFLVAGPVSGPPVDRRHLREMEDYLVDLAWNANPHLVNTTGLRRRDWRIKGLVGGRSSVSVAVTSARSMLGLRR
jgi:hypothetical protein